MVPRWSFNEPTGSCSVSEREGRVLSACKEQIHTQQSLTARWGNRTYSCFQDCGAKWALPMLRVVKTEEIERTRAGRHSKRVSEIAAKKIGE